MPMNGLDGFADAEDPTITHETLRRLFIDPEGQLLQDEEAELLPPLTEAQRATQAQKRIKLFRKGSTFKPTKRKEIVGIDNILGEIDEIIHWLCHSRAYGKHNSRLQPGVIFSGSPGTGKTLVSRWIATASGAIFVNVRDFVHQGALFTDSDIQELFRLARETYANTGRPVVLFWDEFENAAAERGDSGTSPEQRSVVSQLTAELDGIHGKNEGILLIACTNYLQTIDRALVRRGRMGVQIEFHSPDRAGKEKILAYYLGQMKTAPDIDLNTLSYFFPKQNTAADIEEACVEAWRNAVRRTIDRNGKKPLLSQDDLVQVFIKQLVGPPTTFTLPKAEQMAIAIHESGHAICALAYGIPLRLVTVQPGKQALGRCMIDDLQEYIGTMPEAINYMKVGLGGIAAERTAKAEQMTGAEDDIRKVNEIAEHLVSQLAAGSRTGILNITALARQVGYSNLVPQVSGAVISRADNDVLDLLALVEHDAHAATDRVGRAALLKIAKAVNKRVTLTGNEFRELYVDVCGFEPEIT